MAIDWSNEPYARLYKRETDDDLLLSWEARAVWHEFLKKCDRSGLLETRRGVQGIAALLRIPLEAVERVLNELIEDGRLRSVPNVGFVAPNYVEANDTPRSDRARQAESRLRRRVDAVNAGNDQHGAGYPSRTVTHGHAESQDVTHIRSDTDQTQIISTPPASPLVTQPPAAPEKPRREKKRGGIPANWKPRDQEHELAREYGLDCDHEANEFLTYWLGDGRPKANWDQTFRNRLHSQSKRKPNWQQRTSEVREIKEID